MITIELQQIMDARGMSQRELSRLSGVRQERISQICRGVVERLELDHIDAICEALEVTPWSWIVYTDDWMFRETAEPSAADNDQE